MGKKWIDANLIANEDTQISKDKWIYEELMREKPNFNKNSCSRKIFQRKEYSIYKASDGYIVHNTNKKFEKGHTHVRSFSKAKSIVDLCIRRKLPNTPKKWEIECLIRVSNDNTYKNKLRELQTK